MAEIKKNNENGWEKFWSSKVSMPVVVGVGVGALAISGVAGAFAGSAWQKKAHEERTAVKKEEPKQEEPKQEEPQPESQQQNDTADATK